MAEARPQSSIIPIKAKKISTFFCYLAGTDLDIIAQVSKQEIKAYSVLGFINLFLSLVLIPITIFWVEKIFEFKWIICIIIGIILFLPWLFILRLISSLQIRYVSKLGLFIPILTFSLLSYVVLFFITGVATVNMARATLYAKFTSVDYEQWRRTEYTITLTSAIFVGLLCISGPLIILLRKKDLYHFIMQENEAINAKILEEKKAELISNIKRQYEKIATKQVFTEYAEETNNETIRETAENLNTADDPKYFETLGDFQMEMRSYEKALDSYNEAIMLDPDNSLLWKKKTDVLKALGRYVELNAALKHYAELVNKENFLRNIQNKILLKSIEFIDTSFYGSFKWQLTGKINILLGKNGYGKSHLLSIIAALVQADEKSLRSFQITRNSSAAKQVKKNAAVQALFDSEIDEKEMKSLTTSIVERQDRIFEINKQAAEKAGTTDKINQESLNEIASIESEIAEIFNKIENLRGKIYFSNAGMQCSLGKISLLAIPDLRFVNKTTEYTSSVIDDRSKNLLEFGGYHLIEQAPYEQVIQNFLNTICNIYSDQKNFEDEIFKLINRIFKALTGSEFRWDSIKPAQDNSGFIIKVFADGNIEESIAIQKVSQGTISVLAIFGVIYHYLSLRYPKTDRSQVAKQHAIVMIDEIDAHLHPSWQQKIIALLSAEFPNIQFIITAHSPLIVAGCKENEASVLRKTTDGFVIEKIEKSLLGLPIAEIFQIIFEIEERDEMYLEISALLPFKSMIESRYQELAPITKKNKEQENEFEKLTFQMRQLKYTSQVSAIRKSYDQYGLEKFNNKMNKLRESAETSKQRATPSDVNQLVQHIAENDTSNEKLESIKATNVMIPISHLVYIEYRTNTDDTKINLKTDFLDFMKARGISRIILIDENLSVKYVLHKSTIESFIANQYLQQASKGTVNDVINLQALTFADLKQKGDENIQAILKNGIKFISENANLSDAKLLMKNSVECNDIFVTKNGAPKESVIGWITDMEAVKYINK
jgi:predicted ATP-binding protein involved in virulence